MLSVSVELKHKRAQMANEVKLTEHQGLTTPSSLQDIVNELS